MVGRARACCSHSSTVHSREQALLSYAADIADDTKPVFHDFRHRH
jgi:hypothetical protein